MVADWAPGVRTIAKRVLFHSITAFTGWAGFCSSSVAAFASGATCKKAEINANVAKILNICLYLRLLFVRTPVLRHAYLQTVRPREIFLIVIKKITNRWQEGDDATSRTHARWGQLGINQPDT